MTQGNLVLWVLFSVALPCSNQGAQHEHSTALVFPLCSYRCHQKDETSSSSGRVGSFKEATATLGTGHQGLFL